LKKVLVSAWPFSCSICVIITNEKGEMFGLPVLGLFQELVRASYHGLFLLVRSGVASKQVPLQFLKRVGLPATHGNHSCKPSRHFAINGERAKQRAGVRRTKGTMRVVVKRGQQRVIDVVSAAWGERSV
jgi:hypothetical protein